tara:strand:+ start:186 stop:530 length:345 start_codon:yes stop_codon:yes gene_type:complete
MGILDLLGISKISKVKAELRKKNLIPQADLLQQMKDDGYSDNWNEKRRDFEINMLVAQKVNTMAAIHSLGRFTDTRDICYQNGLEDARKNFQNYVDLYEYYIKNYRELGGPTSW